jgi:alkylhydroperoxidase/carboxymuconolactone decarboxylase family protein YurZ
MTDSMPETPVLDLLASMTADSLAASSLDLGSLMLVRLAALVAVDAPPSSYLLNLEAAGEVGLDAESVRGVLAAVAPIVGTARVASATGKIVKALSVAIEIAEEDAQYGRVAAVSGRFRRNLRADPSGVAGRPLVSTVGGWSR